jgi:hypothetical protein
MADNCNKDEVVQNPEYKKDIIRSEIVSVFTKFINKELSSEEEWQLTMLYLENKYLKDGIDLVDEKNSLKWLSLGWYINEFLLKK